MRILIVEDEKELLESLAEGLRISGYLVDTCSNGKSAYVLAYEENYDLIVLDLNLPKMDGLTILKNIRRENKTVNIIILTARSAIEDKIKGFDYGANDYLTKPFHFAELEARVRSLLRRKTIQQDITLQDGQLSFSMQSRETYVKGELISLTNKETCLLEYIMLNKEKIVTIQDLLEHVWDGSVDEFSNSVRVHISALRRKLKNALGYDPICNVIGKGYIMKGHE